MGDFFRRLFRIKGIWLILLGCAAGVALLIFGGVSGEKAVVSENTAGEYAASLQKKCEEIINSIPGVSGAKVVITLSDGGESVYAKNESDGDYVLSDREAIRIMEKSPSVSGIAVVAKGADEATREQKIIELLSSLFGLSSNRIFVSG